MNYEKYRLSPREWALSLLAGAGLAALNAYVFYRSLPAFLLFLPPLTAACPIFLRSHWRRRRLERLAEEFKEGIRVLSASLGSG